MERSKDRRKKAGNPFKTRVPIREAYALLLLLHSYHMQVSCWGLKSTVVEQQISFIDRNLCLLLEKYLPLISEDKTTPWQPSGRGTFLPQGTTINRA